MKSKTPASKYKQISQPASTLRPHNLRDMIYCTAFTDITFILEAQHQQHSQGSVSPCENQTGGLLIHPNCAREQSSTAMEGRGLSC